MAKTKTATATPVDDPKKVVQLVRPNKKTIRVTIIGVSPLITHNWDPDVIDSMDEKQQRKGSSGRKAADPEREFQTARYLDAKGRDCILARAVKKCMVAAATSLNDKRLSKTLLRQAFFVQGDLLPIRIPELPRRRRDIVRVNRGAACVRYRPEYLEWECDLVIDYNENAISQEQIIGILELGGFGVGLHEWRPEKNGNFGRFGVKTR